MLFSAGFGQTPTASSAGSSLFGAQPAASAQGSLFTQNKPIFGGATTTASTGFGFGTSTGTGSNMFGAQNKVRKNSVYFNGLS